jgi:aminoglycoside phosphotransferase
MIDKPARPPPGPERAAAIAARVLGSAPTDVRRFTTGAQHYVYEVAFAGRPAVVARIGGASAHALMAGALHLSRLLRPRGVPLPAVLAADVQAEFPWLLLERLPGADLGDSIDALDDAQLERIAAKIAEAQAITAETGSAGRYGYAAQPQKAPHATWRQALAAHLHRSRQRIASAGLFDVGMVAFAQTAMASLRDEIDRVAPTPFLHDTTTRNVIVTAEGGFSGIVDVDDLCFGDPRYPAALTLAALAARGGPTSYVAAWLRNAGQSDDRLFRLYVVLFLLDFMSEHGQTFNGNEQASSPEARARLSQAFAGAIAVIGA